MRVHASVLACGLRRYATYRAATAAGLLTNTVFGFITASVLLALFTARPHINGYDAADAVTHVFLAQALLAPTAIMGPPLELGERVRTGAVAADLMRPASPLAWSLAEDAGRALFHVVFRGVPTFAIGALAFDLLVPSAPGRWAAFALSLALAVVIGFAVRYLCAMAGFWLLDTRGVTSLVFLIGPACSGMLLPLVLFPAPMAQVMQALPWASMAQFPIEVFLGKGGPAQVAAGLAEQAAWAAGLLALGAGLTAGATRKVVVQGG